MRLHFIRDGAIPINKFSLVRRVEGIGGLATQIAETDKEIDRLVYDLYGLSEEEVGVVEGSGKNEG